MTTADSLPDTSVRQIVVILSTLEINENPCVTDRAPPAFLFLLLWPDTPALVRTFLLDLIKDTHSKNIKA